MVIGEKRVLDLCCGSRMMWFDRNQEDVCFGDNRRETLIVTDRSHGKKEGKRLVDIRPNVVLDFRALPYRDETFYLVVFDPPHLVRAGPRSWLGAKYGVLGDDWKNDLRAGFREALRVLKTHGSLIFKWSEVQIKVREVLECAPVPPLFGNVSGKRSGTHWITFLK